MSCEWQQKIPLYVDNELDSASQQAFAAHLHTCTECSAAMLEEVALHQAVRTAGKRFQAPPDLRLAVEKKLRSRPRLRFAWGWATAAACLMMAALVSVFLFPHKGEGESTLAELVDQHIAALASQNPVDVVSTDRHTVKPWFQGKVPFAFNLPDLENSPFALLGGKVVYLHQTPGAELIYEIRKHKVSIFLFQAKGINRSSAKLNRQFSFTTAAWEQGTLDCYLITDGANEEAQELVRMFQEANLHG
jgi:anti-sigma factor RsiW